MSKGHGRDALETRARKIVEQLGGTWSHSKGMCCCPAHADRKPSLSITLGKRAVLVHCFAGCSNDAVMQAMAGLGVRISDLFDGPRGPIAVQPRVDVTDRNAFRLWLEASALAGTPAERYLAGRGIAVSSPDLRYHPRMPLGPKDAVRFLPAMVAAVRNDVGVLTLNEISPLRRECLRALFPASTVTGHDGELIDELLGVDVVPSVVLMNPPYSHGIERGHDGRTGVRHLRSAWNRLIPGGRLVAVMPEWFDLPRFLNSLAGPVALRLNAAIERAFVKQGTSITTRLLVLDKTDGGDSPIIAKPTSFAELCFLVDALPKRGFLVDEPVVPAKAFTPLRLVAAGRKPVPLAPRQVAAAPAIQPLVYQALAAPAPIAEQVPAEPAPLTEGELARLDVLDASYDENAAVLEDEDSAEEAIAAAEAAIEAIERECQDIRARPPVISPELKAEAGMILVLSRDGTPVLQPVFYGERQLDPAGDDDGIEVITGEGSESPRRSALSKRLVDELAMQRRDVLALHVASDPALALDLIVFTLADADAYDYRARSASTLRGGMPSGPIIGFEAKDAAASASLAELRSGLEESWRAGASISERFDRFRALSDEARAAWLGHVVGRSLEASLNMAGERRVEFHDHLGGQIGIDMAAWWRPTAANYFDRVSKAVSRPARAPGTAGMTAGP